MNDDINKNTNQFAEGELPTPSEVPDSPYYKSGHRPSEVVIQRLLQYAFENIRRAAKGPADDTFRRMFSFYGDEDYEAIRNYLGRTKFDIRKNFPREDAQPPLIAVHSREEAESADQILHHEAITVDRAAGTAGELVGQLETHNVDILIITDDPGTTMHVYRTVKYIIFANKFDLERVCGYSQFDDDWWCYQFRSAAIS